MQWFLGVGTVGLGLALDNEWGRGVDGAIGRECVRRHDVALCLHSAQTHVRVMIGHVNLARARVDDDDYFYDEELGTFP